MAGNTSNILKYPIIVSASMASNITSAITNINRVDQVAIQLNWTGTPVGTFSFQVSNDYAQDQNGNVLNAGNWIAIPVTPSIAAAGSADVAIGEVLTAAQWIRVVYTAASSTGTLNAFLSGKLII